MAGNGSTRRERLLAAIAIAMVLAFGVWLRWPGFVQGGFASHDVGGILYNAMVLADGELPYVADVELKAPGSFYLAWAFAGDRGTDIARLQVWANAWALLSALAVAMTAWHAFGARTAPVAALVAVLADAHLDSMDANYVTWSQLPQILAMSWGLAAARCSGPSRTLGFVVAGAMCGFAMMIKQPTGIVVVALAASVPLWSRDRAELLRAWWHIALGVAVVHVPLALHYAAHGELLALATAYPLNRWGIDYVVAGGRDHPWPLPIEGTLATVHFLALPLVLAAFAIVKPERALARSVAWPLVIWALATIAAAWVGARFYKGYFLAAAPPLALLAAAPWGVLGGRLRVKPALRVALLIPVVVLLARQLRLDLDMRNDRARCHDDGARTIAKHIAPKLPDDATIWVWGWHLWDLYAMTGKRSPTVVYKSLGLITPPNDDTWRLSATKESFVDGAWAHRLIEDFEADPPTYVILGSTAPHRQFDALRELLGRDYVRDHGLKIGRVEIWRRK
ncbi:MAG TPA: hypothetical protein VG755_22480 [Nannocystaceae bacterium]|nr:hypothetical protein [Nannocystaceae bacterium]